MFSRKSSAVFAFLFLAPSVMAQRAPSTQPSPPASQRHDASAKQSDAEAMTDAERIARLQRGIDESQTQIGDLRATLADPKGEYKKAETEFADLDSQYEADRKELMRLKSEGAQGLEVREASLTEAEKKRSLARERFDLAIKERKGLQDQISILEQKVQQDRDALNKLLGIGDAKPAGAEGKEAATTGSLGAPAESTPRQPAAHADTTTSPITEAVNAANPLTAIPQGTAPTADPNATAVPKAPPSEKVIKAQETATSKQAEAQEAEQEAKSITERLDSIGKVIQNEKDLRRTALQKKSNAEATRDALNAESAQKLATGVPYSQMRDLADQIIDVEKRVDEADAEILQRGEVIEARQLELDNLRKEQIKALEDAKRKMEEAEKARKELEHLKNPFAPENIWNWVTVHGLKIGATALIALILLWLIQILEHRMVRLITRHGVAGTAEERESRARTLAGVLQNAGTVMVVVGALLIIIAELGFNITTLLGATAVFGLAVAFGAQNLIRDYFYGFMILMENQYLVNDVVRLGSIAGQVERITLRITVLRDLRGTVHFVPHGQITTVSNLTRGWSRVVLDVGVAYKEDVDKVMKVLADLGRELRRDPAFRDLILDEPEISGVDALNDSAVVVRVLIKTRPLRQWLIKREMLRRIKNKFDEVGIEIPFPHQTVYNRFDNNGLDPNALPAATKGDDRIPSRPSQAVRTSAQSTFGRGESEGIAEVDM